MPIVKNLPKIFFKVIIPAPLHYKSVRDVLGKMQRRAAATSRNYWQRRRGGGSQVVGVALRSAFPEVD